MRRISLKYWPAIVAIAALIPFPDICRAVEADAENPEAAWQRECGGTHDQRMKWWREARFGMFIHWGVYSVPAGVWKGEQSKHIGEWLMLDYKIPVEEYAALAQQFNPVKFDARKIVRAAKDAGMKY